VRVDERAEVAAPPDTVRVLVLGPLAVEHGGCPLHVAGTHRRRLLAYLASRVGQAVGVDAIVDALWADDPPATAARTIQSHVARLRGSFAGVERELIETTGGGYRLALDPAAVDATEFEVLADEGRRRLGVGDFAGAASVLDRALALWRGDAYVDFARSAEFAAAESVRLDLVRWAAAEDSAEARLHCGALESVIASVERLVAEQPGRERAWGLLMWALYAAGRQHDALVAFERARRALADGFGLDPGPDLRALEDRILAQDPALAVRRELVVPAGLRRESTTLAGRRAEWAWLVEGWRAARAGSGQLRLLLGPTDSGRTRLAAELAATATIDGGQVVHVRGEEGFEQPPRMASDGAAAGGIVDRIMERSRTGPVLVVVDDAEWSDSTTVKTIVTLAGSIEHAAVLVLGIADPSGSGPAVQALLRLDPSQGRTLHLHPMDDESLAELVAADGVDGDGVAAVLAVSGGLPGVARREAAGWVERALSDRLTAAASSSIDATAAAVEARGSMFDDVLSLVAARTRRDELTSSTWLGRQPYRALAAYEPHDAELFVGRERLVAELAARVLDRPLVAVVGASGTGKSSLVRAGLVPLVRSGLLPGTGPWRTTVVVPGADPDSVLDAVDRLDEPGPQLLVVDQFEEVFTTGDAAVWAARILDLVLDSAVDARAVIVLRGDQYGMLATVPSLAALVEDAQVVVGPPTDDELRRIIEVPARRTGCHVEPALIDMVLDEVTGHDAALPLVSAALAEVWAHRAADTLTAEGYARLGGLSAAVERMGARAVEQAGGEPGIREVMLRLVDVTDDGQWVRRRVPVDDVPDRLAAAVAALVDARLVQRDDEQIDVVHEVVFQAWPRLAAWLEEARAELVLERELRSAARAWEADGRNDDDLYRGARLATSDEFVSRRTEISPAIREFVAAGMRVAGRIAAERARQRARVNRRLRALLTATAVLLVVAVVAGALALRQASRADDEAAAAEAAATVADARGAAARALETSDIGLALLLAVEAARLDPSAETSGTVLQVLTRLPALPIATVGPPGDEHRPIAVSPDGELLASAEGGRLVMRDAHTLDEVRSADGATGFGPSTIVAFSPDGDVLTSTDDGTLVLRDAATLDVLASTSDTMGLGLPDEVAFQPGGDLLAVAYPDAADTPVRLYDARTLEPAAAQLGGVPEGPPPQLLVYSPDGGRLAVAFAEADPSALVPATAVVWNSSAPVRPVLTQEFPGPWADVDFSADGTRVHLNVFPPGDVIAYDIATGERVAESIGTGGFVETSPDGSILAVTGKSGGPITLLDSVTLAEIRQLPLPSDAGWLFAPRFSRDGTKVFAVGGSGRVYAWDVESGEEARGIGGGIDASYNTSAVLLNPVDDTVYTSTSDELAAWDIDPGPSLIHRSTTVATPSPEPSATYVVNVSDSLLAYVTGHLATGTSGDSMQFFDDSTGHLGDVIDLGHGTLGGLTVRGDGARIATSGSDGTVRMWDPRTGALLEQHRITDEAVVGLTYSVDDTRLLVTEQSGDLYLIDAETLAPVGLPVRTGEILMRAQLDAGEPSAVVTTVDGEVLLVDLSEGRVVDALDPGFEVFGATSSPDGGTLAITGIGGDVRFYDREARRWLGPSVHGHLTYVASADFAADGSLVVTGGVDGRLGLWDVRTAELIGTVVPGAFNEMIIGRFVGDTRTVTAVSRDGSRYTWDADPDHWIEVACDAARRNLTADEWRDAFGDRPYRATCPSN
jgi:WD40 repeat protein/DNA-binding SARP family transcriptional activator